MAHGQAIIWVCDRCSRKVDAADGQPPLGWKAVQVTALREGGNGSRSAELCDGCSTQILRFMQPSNAPNNRGESDGGSDVVPGARDERADHGVPHRLRGTRDAEPVLGRQHQRELGGGDG